MRRVAKLKSRLLVQQDDGWSSETVVQLEKLDLAPLSAQLSVLHTHTHTLSGPSVDLLSLVSPSAQQANQLMC